MRQEVLRIQPLMVLSLLCVSWQSSAAIVQLDFTVSFGTTPANGPAPWLEAEFDDSVGAGNTVRLTIDAFASLQQADVTELYFNLNPALDPTLLSFVRQTPLDADLGAITVFNGTVPSPTDAHRADGDGFYDFFFDLPTGDSAQRLNAGETLIYDISYSGDLSAVGNVLSASDFFFLSAPGPGSGNPGPFLAAAHIQSTGADLQGSDWVAAVPLPAAVWLFASALAFMRFGARAANARRR